MRSALPSWKPRRGARHLGRTGSAISHVAAVSRAAAAVGADGLIIEVHPCPERALSDGAQSLDFAGFEKVMKAIADPMRKAALPVERETTMSTA